MTMMPQGTDGRDDAAWRLVDDGWGRRAVDFATLSEPANCREYVALHHRLTIGSGDRVLDVACGAGLAVELAEARGAVCAGIDASPRLLAVARDRNPDADLRVGDMHALPRGDATFDVVELPGDLGDDARRARRGVPRTGPRRPDRHHCVGPYQTVTGRLVARAVLARRPAEGRQPGRDGLARASRCRRGLLARFGFVDIERVDIPFAWEFADESMYARTLASTGPAYEAIQTVGEAAFTRFATDLAAERLREELPLRAPIAVVGYLARKPAVVTTHGPVVERAGRSPDTGFLDAAPASDESQHLFDHDVAEVGYVMNNSRLWAHRPTLQDDLFALLGQAQHVGTLSFRDRGILVAACASTLGEAYSSLAWGTKLAGEAGPDVAAAVLRGDDAELSDHEAALARWARRITRDPNSTDAADVQALRDAGYTDIQILAITVYVSLRIAFSTVNDALGARPDRALAERAPAPIREAVTFGRPIADSA